MKVRIFDDKVTLGKAAAAAGAEKIRAALRNRGRANIILATGASQFEMLAALLEEPGIDWSRIRIFHLDEYIGLPADAPQRFGNFLSNAIFNQAPFRAVHLMDSGGQEGRQECLRYGKLIESTPLDIVSLGIGENGHIAFNDPHEARFDDPETVKITTLDEQCRQQQVNDGEFADISLVPRQAMTLTIPTLMSCRCVVGIVPLARKAKAVHDTLYGLITEQCPASILRTHNDATLFLDLGAASALRI